MLGHPDFQKFHACMLPLLLVHMSLTTFSMVLMACIFKHMQCKLVDACEETVSNYGLVEIVTTLFWRYD